MLPQEKARYDEFRRIGVFKFILILLVVLVHCNFLNDEYRRDDRMSIFTSFLQWTSDLLTSNAVPAFFILSGFLFFRNGVPTKAEYIRKIKHRSKSLLIPYLIWNTIGLVIFLIKTMFLRDFLSSNYSDINSMTILSGYFALPDSVYPYDLPLWFIRNLIIVVCLTPIIGYLIRYLRIFAIFLIWGIIELITQGFMISDLYNLGSSCLLFTIGGYIACQIPQIMQQHKVLPLMLSYLLLCFLWKSGYCCTALSQIIEYAKFILFTIIGLNLCDYLNHINIVKIKFVEKASFFVYAFHGLYWYVAQKIICRMIPPISNTICFIDYLLIFILLFGGSIVAYCIFEKLTPRMVNILTGNREYS